jgi:RND superfamily putative drug exporter
MMLVPSIMEILGDANWWFPKWLEWLPRLDIDTAERPRGAPSLTPTIKPASAEHV